MQPGKTGHRKETKNLAESGTNASEEQLKKKRTYLEENRKEIKKINQKNSLNSYLHVASVLRWNNYFFTLQEVRKSAEVQPLKIILSS